MTHPATDYMKEFDFGFRLDPARTALVIIDMQYASACRTTGLGKWLADGGRAEMGKSRFDRIEGICVPTIQRLLRFFRERRMRVIYVTIGSLSPDYADMPRNLRQVARSVGNRVGEPVHAILREIAPEPDEIVMNKTTTGAFQSTGLDAVLRTLGIEGLLFCGVSTDQCVESTARVAADLGYDCVIVEDGCASTAPERHDATLRGFGRFLGRVASADALMAELARP